MANGIYVAASGAAAQLRKLDVVANNMANVNTPGFKRDTLNFREVLANTTAPIEKQDMSYCQLDSTSVIMEDGAVVQTENPLDLALNGNAFLRVETAQGEQLSRNGRLMMMPDGQLTTMQGHAVLDDGGSPIFLPTDAAPIISTDGTIRAGGKAVGKLGLASVPKGTPLSKRENGMFALPAGVEPMEDKGRVMQGYIENSNSEAISMMVEMIEVQRNFEALHQAISTHQTIDRRVIRLTS